VSHRPRKRFGQHFLHDPWVVRRIVAAVDPRPGERILEIGPGEGVLTRPLLEAAGALDVVELDRDLAAALAGSPAAQAGRLRVHALDVLAFDPASLAAGPAALRVVGNLPYNVSTPILFHLLARAELLRDLHLMLQREVVARMAAGPGGRDYGRLSVMVQIRCRVERLFTVGPGAFRPPPKVDSEVVRLVPWQEPPVPLSDPDALDRVVQAAFGQRRKTLRNALRPLLPAAAIAAAGVDPDARAETLDLAAFAALAERLEPGR
jgi:16S rRNA (adenine1518-N6/adenine1519-N6)-dimethyltransferase